jgi:glycine betaine/proline transport system ATP-binding protein
MHALDQVGLTNWADQPPRALSGGMQQRVGLARGIATEAEILLMDEPFSALDPLIRRDMQHELLALEKSLNMTIVFISHDLNEALFLGDRIAIMKDGRFVQVGTPEEIVASPADDYVQAFTKDVDRGRVFTAASVMEDAAALDIATDTPETALTKMETLGRDGLLVTEGDQVVGAVTYQDVARAARHNGGDLAHAVRRDWATVQPDDFLADIYQQCHAGLPIAVVGRNGALHGALDPLRLFDQLAAETTKPRP